MKLGKSRDESESVKEKLQRMRSGATAWWDRETERKEEAEQIENFLALTDEKEQIEFIQDIIERYEDDGFQAPPDIVDQFFTYVSDMSSSSEVREMIFRVFILVIQYDQRGEWRNLIKPQDMIMVLNGYIPDPHAVSLLSLLLKDALANAAFFLKHFRYDVNGNLLEFNDFFKRLWAPTWGTASALRLLELLEALATHVPLLPRLNEAKLQICDTLYSFSSEVILGAWRVVALFAADKSTRSDIYYTRLFKLDSVDLVHQSSLREELLKLLRSLIRDSGCSDVLAVAPLPFLLNLAVTNQDERTIRRICRILSRACGLAGVDVVQWVLDKSVVPRLLRLHGCVSHRTWSAVIVLFSELFCQANEEQTMVLLTPSTVEHICEFTSTVECQPPRDSPADRVLCALDVISGAISSHALSFPPPILDNVSALAQAEGGDFHPLADFLAALGV